VFRPPRPNEEASAGCAIANAGQSIELVRSPRIVGVSVPFLILAVGNQGLWLTWAILVPDIGTITVAAVTGTITAFNLIWWSLRKLGMRPFWLRYLSSPTTVTWERAAAARQQCTAEAQPQTGSSLTEQPAAGPLPP
jgi:hypothetical protein